MPPLLRFGVLAPQLFTQMPFSSYLLSSSPSVTPSQASLGSRWTTALPCSTRVLGAGRDYVTVLRHCGGGHSPPRCGLTPRLILQTTPCVEGQRWPCTGVVCGGRGRRCCGRARYRATRKATGSVLWAAAKQLARACTECPGLFSPDPETRRRISPGAQDGRAGRLGPSSNPGCGMELDRTAGRFSNRMKRTAPQLDFRS